MSPGSTVICDRSITRAPFACPWTCASGPTVLIRSPSIRMPTPDCGASDRPSISRPALMRIGGAGWAGRGTCAHAVVATASWAIRAKLGRIAVSLWGEANLLVTASLSSLRLGDSPTEATVAVRVTCQCGTSYELKDEFAGRLVKCPQCGRENRVPGVAPAAAVQPQADPVFDRDVFLLRQQLLRISEKYDVADEQGKKIVFGERPAHLLRNVGALLAAVAAAGVGGVGFGILSDMAKGTAFEGVLAALAVIGALAALIAVGVGLSAKRHVTFYRDETKRDKLLEVLQDREWQPITATYTVRDRAGRTMALLWKNYLYNIVRKRWYVKAPDGATLYVAKEDSIILSLLRRLLGPLFGLLRTNFIIVRSGSEDAVGEFHRKFTLLDRYVLDLKADRVRAPARRVALALGVMLDTGERR